MYKFKRQDWILAVLGLIGAVLLWIDIDPGGRVLYISFLSFGGFKVAEFFALNPYQRTKVQIIKFLVSLLMIITVITHVIWGGEPLFGLLATLLLCYLIANLEPRDKSVKESEV